jgi:hypothetical protein
MRGFTLVEAAAVVAVAGVLVALVFAAGHEQRRNARMGDDLAHLRQIGVGTGSYGADFADRMWTFSWRMGTAPIDPTLPESAGLTTAADDLQASRNQMTFLVRTRGGRVTFPSLGPISLFTYATYSHVVLADYLDRPLPAREFVSSADRDRLLWAQDPLGYDQGLYSPNLGTGGTNERHPYGTSLRLGTSFYDSNPVNQRIGPGPTTGTYLLAGGNGYFGQALSTISYPSQKVMLHDQFARHMGDRVAFCTHPEARLPMLFSDGSVAVRSAAESNAGANPNSGALVSMTYSPSAIDPPATGPNADLMLGKFEWTNGGLLGRDFGGPVP